MSGSSPGKKTLRKITFVSLLLLICVALIYAAIENRDWNVPPEAKEMTNPLQTSEANLKAARDIYSDKCSECHGDTGKGDGRQAAQHYPSPTDFTSKDIAGISDGELFYKIGRGKRPMPSFQKRLSADQRWQLVLLIRSFAAPSSARPSSEPAKSSGASGAARPNSAKP
jgi:mono/diheme cytochrome c family protein